MTSHPPGKSIYDIRRENLNHLTKEQGAKTQLALRLGVSQARITHLLKAEGPNARRITTDQARELEQIMGLSSGALDRDAAQPMPPRGGAPDMNTMLGVVRLVTTAQQELGVSLDAQTTSDLVSAVYDLTRPGELVPLPVVKSLVKLATRRDDSLAG